MIGYNFIMGKELQKWLKLSKQLPPREEVVLNINVALTFINSRFSQMIESFDITPVQYNVLRILKGVHPEGHARCEIAMRMIERASDVTRIIDRLEKQGLVERDRTGEDRRMSITRITEKGIKLVEQINPLLSAEHVQITQNLSEQECQQLSDLIEKFYSGLIEK